MAIEGCMVVQRRGYEVNVKRVYRLYAEEGPAGRRRKHKRLVRDRAPESRLIRPNRERAKDFIIDGQATGRMVRMERLIGERWGSENLRSDNGLEFTSRCMLGWADD
jgi:hypothetical protein